METLQKIMSWYPNKRFYKRQSSRSGKQMITVYPQEFEGPIYSHEEWYKDDYEIPYFNINPGQSFFIQFSQLQKVAPVVSLLSTLQENAEYCHDVEGLRNSYIVFDAITGENLLYCVRMYNSNDCTDCYWIKNSQLLYDCTYMFDSYNCRYSYNCVQASDSFFLSDCRNVQNCFMSHGLRNKSYCIKNKQYTKEEYEQLINEINFANYSTVIELKKYWLENIIQKAQSLINTENCTGNFLRDSKNCQNVFESFNMLDSQDCFQCSDGKDITSSFMCNDKIQNCFQSVATGIGSSNVRNSLFTWHSSTMEYCYLCINCQDCFGCIGLRGKQYHILNKPYSEEEYSYKVKEIKNSMGNLYGSFFPQDMSPFRYEDTIAYDFFENFGSNTFQKEYESRHLIATDPKTIQTCSISDQQFKCTSQEIEFYNHHKIPKPRVSFPVRYLQRMELMNTDLGQ
jgi:hypothetical protein